MALTNEQEKQIKEHLLKQLINFPEDRKKEIESQIESMTPQELENFIKQNELTHLGGQCIMCSIISGEQKSFRIAQNKDSIAILEINPLSKGHTLILPKDHKQEISESNKKLAEDVSKRIKSRFNPKEIKINELNIMDHNILEVIPFYGNESKKSQATEEQLSLMQEEITKPIKEIQEEIKEKEKTPKIQKFPPRLPLR